MGIVDDPHNRVHLSALKGNERGFDVRVHETPTSQSLRIQVSTASRCGISDPSPARTLMEFCSSSSGEKM